MKKSLLITSMILVLLVLVIAGCKQPVVEPETNKTINESIVENLDNLTTPEISIPVHDKYIDFDFEYSERAESKYELAEVDVLTLDGMNVMSTEISVFGLMLGDSKDKLVETLGTPNTIYEPASKEYQNYGYSRRIGVNTSDSALIFHLVEDKIERITVTGEFNKYLHGNSTVGISKQMVYTLLDIPDYQDFLGGFRVFYYVERGIEVYLRTNNVDRWSFVMPKEFKGVEYITTKTDVGSDLGILADTIKPVPN